MKIRYPCPLLLAGLVAGLVSGCGKKEHSPPAPVPATSQPSPTTASAIEFGTLKGRWMRPDGGYVLEFRSVDPTGKLDAGYFNPRSINVGKAQASWAGDVVKVFVELRDVNYPGSTYTLTYDPAANLLKGLYYQAATKETYQVGFVRMKP